MSRRDSPWVAGLRAARANVVLGLLDQALMLGMLLATAGHYRDVIVPILFATRGVCIPIVTIPYSLPSELQIPLCGLALSIGVMLYTWMSEQRAQ